MHPRVICFSGSLKNSFDKDKVQRELDLQRTVSQDFNKNIQAANAEINQHLDTLKAQLDKGEISQTEYDKKVDNWQKGKVLLNAIATGLSAPTQSATGIAAATISPALSYAIGQEFKKIAKENKRKGITEGAELTKGQETAHILAHAVLGAAVSAAGGNNALAGGLSAGSAEAAAPIISQYLYGEKDGSKLNAEQKQTLSTLTSLLGTSTGAAVGNTIADTVSGSLNANSAVGNNFFGSRKYREYLRNKTDDFSKKSLALEEKLKRLGVPDLEPYAEAYEKCGGCAEADRNAAQAFYDAKQKITELIVNKQLTSDEIMILQQQSGDTNFFGLWGNQGKGTLIRGMEYDNVVTRMSVESQANMVNFVSSLATNLSPIQSGARDLMRDATTVGQAGGTVKKLPTSIKGQTTRTQQGVPKGSLYIPESKTPIADQTVQLSQTQKLTNGEALPAGTVVTLNGNAMKAVLPNGQIIKGNSDKLLSGQKALFEPKQNKFHNQFPEHPIGTPQIYTQEQLKHKTGKMNYVVLENGTLIIGRKKNELGGGHIDLAKGKPVLAAGEVKFVNGKVIYIDNSSGHYEPRGKTAEYAATTAFKASGFDVSNKYQEKIWKDGRWQNVQ